MSIDPQRLRDLVAAAGLPAVTDTAGVAEIFGIVTGAKPSENTIRRDPELEYCMPARKRIYQVESAFAVARKRIEQAPVRRAVPYPRKRQIAAAE